jgi:hypothetical protein
VRCTKAMALRHEMREYWELLGEEWFQYTSPDWLLHLISSVDSEARAKILLILWRAWYIRNDITHGKGTTTITGSAHFLKTYVESLGLVEQKKQVWVNDKGKEKVEEGSGPCKHNQRSDEPRPCWTPPPVGWAKLNTDAGFCDSTGLASSRVVIRDANGKGVALCVVDTRPSITSRRSGGCSVPGGHSFGAGVGQNAN